MRTIVTHWEKNQNRPKIKIIFTKAHIVHNKEWRYKNEDVSPSITQPLVHIPRRYGHITQRTFRLRVIFYYITGEYIDALCQGIAKLINTLS